MVSRIVLSIVFALTWSSMMATAATTKIETGADLVSACEAFAKLSDAEMAQQTTNALRPHHCHKFFGAYAAGDRAARDTRVIMMQGPGTNCGCVHLPEFLLYRDMAARVVAHRKREPALLQGPAFMLAQRTLEHDFPCAPDRYMAPAN